MQPNTKLQKILVLRFSAMGDVALVAPVIWGLTQKYPNVSITVLTRPKFAWFFEGMPQVNVIGADIDGEYKGLFGLFNLYLKISKENFDGIIDLHDHLRTKVLRSFFKFNIFNINRPKVVIFEKGRADKKAITRKNDKKRLNLPHTTARYAAAFEVLGCTGILPKDINTENPVFQFLPKTFEKKAKSIGIAPFAKHETKQWGVLNFLSLIGILIEKQPEIQIYLIGGGAQEVAELEKIHNFYPKNTHIAAGKHTIQAEIGLMQTLDLMVCMDSSNLHLAALAGVPTVSIWGATDKSTGFAPFGNTAQHTIVEIATTTLPCRPCSVFGDKPCFRGDHACMTQIQPQIVADAILKNYN